ncbi:MAG: DUF2281 domain-containing protein [Chitinivibrionia bacterium]|nr:DUF2281 domain-containing protein [Chitinivibrionia bacterium]
MTVSAKLLSEIELLPREYEQEVLNYVSFLRTKPRLAKNVFVNKESISIEDAYGILKGTGIDSNFVRDEEDRY